MQAFANKVNSGFENRYPSFPTKNFREQFDHAIKEGPLSVDRLKIPSEYEKYFLKRPVQATITEVRNLQKHTSNSGSSHTTKGEVTIDAGGINGLLPGMVLYFVDTNHTTAEVELKEVEEYRSRGDVKIQIYANAPQAENLVQAGAKLSTSRAAHWDGR